MPLWHSPRVRLSLAENTEFNFDLDTGAEVSCISAHHSSLLESIGFEKIPCFFMLSMADGSETVINHKFILRGVLSANEGTNDQFSLSDFEIEALALSSCGSVGLLGIDFLKNSQISTAFGEGGCTIEMGKQPKVPTLCSETSLSESCSS